MNSELQTLNRRADEIIGWRAIGRFCRVTTASIKKWHKRHPLPVRHINNRIRIYVSDLTRYLQLRENISKVDFDAFRAKQRDKAINRWAKWREERANKLRLLKEQWANSEPLANPPESGKM